MVTITKVYQQQQSKVYGEAEQIKDRIVSLSKPYLLWRMRKFYLNYEGEAKLAPLVQQIGWSHNIVILEKCKDELAREFYIKMAVKYGWTRNVLIHQIEGKSYEQFLLGQTNFDKTLP